MSALVYIFCLSNDDGKQDNFHDVEPRFKHSQDREISEVSSNLLGNVLRWLYPICDRFFLVRVKGS